jgi:hypothetical protein
MSENSPVMTSRLSAEISADGNNRPCQSLCPHIVS